MSLGAIVWTGVAAFAAYRAIVRPVRAVFDDGELTACAGSPGCAPVLGIRTTSTNPAPVYSLVGGVVSRVTPDRLEVISDYEPVIVGYLGSIDLSASIVPGQRVHAGEVLGQATSVGLAVSNITRLTDGSLALVPMEPASWLAVRGLRAATRLQPSIMWCAGGRTLTVPQDVARCGLRLPEPSGFSLLPVSVQLG